MIFEDMYLGSCTIWIVFAFSVLNYLSSKRLWGQQPIRLFELARADVAVAGSLNNEVECENIIFWIKK